WRPLRTAAAGARELERAFHVPGRRRDRGRGAARDRHRWHGLADPGAWLGGGEPERRAREPGTASSASVLPRSAGHRRPRLPLDRAADGVVDNVTACAAKFDPATFVFGATNQPLQCTGGKNATCLTAAQITAVKKINSGPRNLRGEPIKAPAASAAREPINASI